MKQLALIVILFATATAAQAGEERSSLFACGVNFGGNQLTYSTPAESTSKKEYRAVNRRLQYVTGAVRTETLRFIPAHTSEFTKKEKRLPRKFTFATFGCSWR